MAIAALGDATKKGLPSARNCYYPLIPSPIARLLIVLVSRLFTFESIKRT